MHRPLYWRGWVTALTVGLLLLGLALPGGQLATANAQPGPATWPTFDTAVALEGTSLVATVLTARVNLISHAWLAVVNTEGSNPPNMLALSPLGDVAQRAVAVDPARRRVFVGGRGDLAIYDHPTARLRTIALPAQELVYTLTYNPVTDRLYAMTSSFPPIVRTFVFDGQGALLGHLPVGVIGVDPGLNRLYAREDTAAPAVGANAVRSRLLALDGASEQPVPGAVLERAVIGFPPWPLLVDRRAHRVLFMATGRSGGSNEFYVADGRTLAELWAGAIGPFNPRQVGVPTLVALNEATGRAYFDTASDASTLRIFGCLIPWRRAACTAWEASAGGLLAVDSVRNQLYFGKGERYNEHTAGMGQDTLLWMTVADGQTEAVTRLVPVFSPRRAVAAMPLSAPVDDSPDQRYFPETGHTIRGLFKRYWEERGGLTVFGYPLTEEFVGGEVGGFYERVGYAQYFERVRLEYHPLYAGTPNEVQVQTLGLQFAAVQPGIWPGSDSSADRVWFEPYGHTLAYGFKHYWEANGGLAVFGYPITEEFDQVSPTDGQVYTVQYFERARFEYHPEHQGTPYEVQLGLLGRQALQARGWLS